MPKAPPVVIWRNAPNAEPNYAIVTRYGRSAISVMIFPPDSRVGVPRDGVRFLEDPINRLQGIGEGGIWEYTDETKLIQELHAKLESFAKPAK